MVRKYARTQCKKGWSNIALGTLLFLRGAFQIAIIIGRRPAVIKVDGDGNLLERARHNDRCKDWEKCETLDLHLAG